MLISYCNTTEHHNPLGLNMYCIIVLQMLYVRIWISCIVKLHCFYVCLKINRFFYIIFSKSSIFRKKTFIMIETNFLMFLKYNGIV